MTCRNDACGFDRKLQRTLTVKLSRDRVRYAQLWSEVELPKLLKENEGEAK